MLEDVLNKSQPLSEQVKILRAIQRAIDQVSDADSQNSGNYSISESQKKQDDHLQDPQKKVKKG